MSIGQLYFYIIPLIICVFDHITLYERPKDERHESLRDSYEYRISLSYILYSVIRGIYYRHMPLDPFQEKMTVQGQIKKQIIAVWPTVYYFINGLFNVLFSALSEMVRSAVKVFKP